ncbi:MAG: AAA family ATPase [Desulfobacteraceae bacterium]|nr:AAA family ATPase [Desulfobacteraceae bacterium]
MATLFDFTHLEKLYESASTIVYRGKEENPVIIKLLKQDFPSQEKIAQYQQEFEILENLDFDEVIKPLKQIKIKNRPGIVFEDFNGHSLDLLLNKQQLSLEELLGICICITKGLEKIHGANIIHKDINPTNIVFNRDTGQLKIIDFGVSTVLSRENPEIKNLETLDGTLSYISPEQTGRMNRSVDYRTDFYSLGITMYELFSGQLPFKTKEPMELIHCHMTKKPVPLHEINPEIPKVISDIVMKLLEKTAEKRYQSVWGIRADLERYRLAVNQGNLLHSFAIGQFDVIEKFHIPQKLYGREDEIQILIEAFLRTSKKQREMMLVSGPSGIGKTFLVREIYKPVTKQQGYFISGKFEQFQKNVPYSALVNAFQELMHQLLTERDHRLEKWRHKLLNALGSNGQIIINIIPELELILGRQSHVNMLPPTESQNRFNKVFQNFIQVFYKPEHPLVIFLDDLQWADPATLKLLELIMADDQTNCLFLIGAYRDNEVSPDHPLTISIEKLEKAGLVINTISLPPLGQEHIAALICDTLQEDSKNVSQLAGLVLKKTGGNPFFVNQFLNTLYQKSLIRPSEKILEKKENSPWQWDMDEIKMSDITDNVVVLMIENLKKLPEHTIEVLKLAACVGNHFDLNTLSIIHENSLGDSHKHLMPAVLEGLIMPISVKKRKEGQSLYIQHKFLHDRVQQAAYGLIDDNAKQSVHLKIGRLLLYASSKKELEKRMFEVVDQLNLGRSLISEEKEKLALAQFNLETGQKAKLSTAFSSALVYFKTGLELSGSDWSGQYQLVVSLHKELAEVEYLMGNFPESQKIINIIWKNGLDLDKAEAYALLITQYTVLGKNKAAIKAASCALPLFDLQFPVNNLRKALDSERARVKKNIGKRSISSLIDLHETKDPRIIATLKVLMTVHTPIYFDNQHDLYGWTLAKMVNLSLENGHIAETSKGYASFGNTLSASFEEYETGYEFGLLALKLSQKYNSQSLICKNALILSMFLNHWVKHIKEAEIFDNQGDKAGHEAGELQFIGYILTYGRTVNRFHMGMNLENLKNDLDQYLIYTRKVNHNLSTDTILGARQLLSCLDGELDHIQWFSSKGGEKAYIVQCEENKSFAALAFYQTVKAQIIFLGDNPSLALECLKKAELLIDYVKGVFTTTEFNFYYSLTLIALCDNASDQEKKSFIKRIVSNQNRMKIWSTHCPENFLHKYLLVEAELERINHHLEEAMELYDRAVASARDNNFIQNEALCNELAGKFWLQKEKKEFASIYINKAFKGYRSWGALFKCRNLSKKYGDMITPDSEGLQNQLESLTGQAIGTDQTSLDFLTVLKASQAISKEIKLGNLLKKLMDIVMENAGAEKGFLIVNKDSRLMVEVKAFLGKKWVYPSSPVSDGFDLSAAIVHYVARTNKDIVLDDASKKKTFHNDFYIRDKKPKSVLCIPIITRGKLAALIYLENNQATGVFTSQRLELIKTIASQAAISLENAAMYNSLEKSEQNYRSLFENAVEGIFRTTLDGRFLTANPAAAKILGYSSPDELVESNFQTPTHLYVDPHDRTRLLEMVKSRGQISDFETLFYKKDGSKFFVLLSIRAEYDAQGKFRYFEGSFIDINERKEKEEAKREQRIAQESNKAKTQFLANMSHEIRTPMNAIIGLTYLAMKTHLTSKQRSYLQKINTASQSLLAIINDILDFSKIEAGKLKVEAIDFSLEEVMDSLSTTIGPDANEKGLEFLIRIENQVPNYLVGDPLRLIQILTNLCTNAVKFTPSGKIIVGVRLADEQSSDRCDGVILQFDVTDTGIGLTTKEQNALFQRFSQADASTTRKYGGTGLGLSISKRLARLMGGDIWVKSELAKGTTFSFNAGFGIQPDKKGVLTLAQLPPNPDDQKTLHALAGTNILLVEDNEINQLVVKELLVQVGINISIAGNGIQCLEKIKKGDFEIVLMDIQMPEMDGYEATRQLRESGSGLPIIAMTARAMPGEREKCLAMGMNDYISKPINPPDLYSKLLKWIVPGKNIRFDPGIENGFQTLPGHDMETVLPLQIEGIDMETGLIRVGNNKKLYKDLLINFKKEYVFFGDKMKVKLKAKDHGTAGRMLHTIKGMAGNLGALNLYDAAVALETGIINGKTDQEKTLMLSFEENLNRVIQGLDGLQTEDSGQKFNKNSGKISPVNIEKVQPLLIKLEQYLKSDLIAATKIMDSLEAHLSDSVVCDRFKNLKEQVTLFDTQNALQTLSDITKQIPKH